MNQDIRPILFLLIADHDPEPLDYMTLFLRAEAPCLSQFFEAVDSLKDLGLLFPHNMYAMLTAEGKELKESALKFSPVARLGFAQGYIDTKEAYRKRMPFNGIPKEISASMYERVEEIMARMSVTGNWAVN